MANRGYCIITIHVILCFSKGPRPYFKYSLWALFQMDMRNESRWFPKHSLISSGIFCFVLFCFFCRFGWGMAPPEGAVVQKSVNRHFLESAMSLTTAKPAPLRCKLPACTRVLNGHLSFASWSLRRIPIGWFDWREGVHLYDHASQTFAKEVLTRR